MDLTMRSFGRYLAMSKGHARRLVHSAMQNWSPSRWKGAVRRRLPGPRRSVLLPDAAFDPAEVHYAAVWKPNPGELAAFPNLRVIFNLGASVDALMAGPLAARRAAGARRRRRPHRRG